MDYGMGQYTNTDLKKFILSALSSMNIIFSISLSFSERQGRMAQQSKKSDRAAGMRGKKCIINNMNAADV